MHLSKEEKCILKTLEKKNRVSPTRNYNQKGENKMKNTPTVCANPPKTSNTKLKIELTTDEIKAISACLAYVVDDFTHRNWSINPSIAKSDRKFERLVQRIEKKESKND